MQNCAQEKDATFEWNHYVDKCDQPVAAYISQNKNLNPNTSLILIYASTCICMLHPFTCSFYTHHSFSGEETQLSLPHFPDPPLPEVSLPLLFSNTVFLGDTSHLHYVFLIGVPPSILLLVQAFLCNGLHLIVCISLWYINQLRAETLAR